VTLLKQLPPPTETDEKARNRREPLDQSGRRALAGRYFAGLLLIVIVYTLITVLRSIRDDFAPELFRGLGEPAAPESFASSDLLIAIGILAISGCSILIRDNRRAFFASLVVCILGCGVLIGTILVFQTGRLGAFAFMVLAGLGLYIPYVTIHTTVFERLLATTRDVGNVGFLMYLADSFGYLGYVAVMIGLGWFGGKNNESLVPFFLQLCLWVAVSCLVLLGLAARYFARRISAAKSAGEANHA
jgi:hypothetical protein